MLQDLRGYPLLTGFRGGRRADLDQLADVIVRVAGLATALGSAVDSVEVNPLLVDGDRIEALDALITPASSSPPRR
jgi:succinyl-CoA synthetase beta subunit